MHILEKISPKTLQYPLSHTLDFPSHSSKLGKCLIVDKGEVPIIDQDLVFGSLYRILLINWVFFACFINSACNIADITCYNFRLKIRYF